ncbi:MAG: peroxiredoxin [Haliea sp.]|jgi:thioredoxin-dependent peroxiredoxin|nr:peroxiredoxin [Haliea sp.]
MKLIRSLALLCMMAFVMPSMAEELNVGAAAPDFSLMGSDGKLYSLADFKGKQAVVLAWYPRAFTSGCTVECKSLAENGHLIREYDVTYFMASVDAVEDNRKFAEETEADFPLLSDPEKSVAEAYGVLAMMGFAKRHTFYIGVDGTILKVDRSISPATAAQDMAANLATLGVPKR